MVILLPRLSGPVAADLLDRFLGEGLTAWAGFDPDDLPEAVRFAATGGSRIGRKQLLELREAITQVARENGFGSDDSRISHARFDAEMSAVIADMPPLAGGEALRDDSWTFIGVALAPDVVHWRFGKARERYLGGVRNTFQRLWLRARALDRGTKHPARWELLEKLTEDALVQITERPSIGGDPILARAVAEAWLRASAHHGSAAMEPIMRRAILRVRIWNEIRSLSDLPPDMLVRILDGAFGLPADDSQERAAVEELAPPSDRSRRQANPPSTEPDDPVSAISHAASRIRTVAKQRRWLSPKSTAALTVLEEGQRDLARSECNALLHLLWRMRAAALLSDDVALVLQRCR